MIASDFRQPGDWAVCPVGGPGGMVIGIGEWWCGRGFGRWRHAKMYIGQGMIIQAEPGGAQIIKQDLQPGDKWSSGTLAVSDIQRDQVWDAAHRYGPIEEYGQVTRPGVGYSWLDYAAIGTHDHHVTVPGLRAYIASTGHMICSQLVDQISQDIGVHLFDDGRWPGYVMPMDLAWLLEPTK